MTNLKEMFHTYIADIFPADAEFVDNGEQKLKVIYRLPEITPSEQYDRSVIIEFESNVTKEFQIALDKNNVPRQDRIGDALCETVRRSLENYAEHKPLDTAFNIYIDSRATDL